MPNVTGVPNVLTVPNVPKMTMNNPSVPKSYLAYQQIQCTTGVPNVKCTKVHQMYQNSLGMMPSVLSTGPILSVPKYNGVL